MIAFFSDRDGNDELYVMNANGSDQRNLTQNRFSDTDPAWSPDGTQIAFASTRDRNYEIYVMDADGSNIRRLTDHPAIDAHPTWSPDSSRIAFLSRRDGNVEVYMVNADGSDLQRITFNSYDDFEINWSPDGKLIALASAVGEFADIYTINVEGASEGVIGRNQLTDTEAHDAFPVWSPDGLQIAFISNRDGDENWEVYIMNSDGSDQRRLTYSAGLDGIPTWSPDGTRIAFESNRDGDNEIYVVDVEEAMRDPEGAEVIRLTDNDADDQHPVWRPLVATGGSAGTWIRAFEGADYGAFFDIALSEDESVVAVGATNHLHTPPYSGDALLMKLTLEGDVLWERAWGGDGYEQAMSVVPAGDGGAYIFGETDSYGAGDRDFFLLKIANDGTEEWFQTYGKARREWPFGMLRLSNGDLLIYGFTEPQVEGGRDQYALRLEPDGDVIWEYVQESPDEEFVIDALETAEGDLVLAVVVEEDSKLVRLDADGTVRWTKRYELAGWQFASQVAPIDGGDFLLAGFSMSNGSRPQADTWLARCTPAGELAWETSFGDSTYDDYAQSLIRLHDGTFLIGGIGNGMLLSRVDQEGNVLWRRSLLGEAVHGAPGLIELEGGGYLVAGFVQIINGRSYDAILLRTDAEGRVGD